jgi:hypothetical protein
LNLLATRNHFAVGESEVCIEIPNRRFGVCLRFLRRPPGRCRQLVLELASTRAAICTGRG